MNFFALILATDEVTEPVDSAGGLGIGAIALLLAVVLLMGWMGYLFVNSRRSRAAAQEAAPSNLSPHVSDEELENVKLTRVLRAALFGSALLAIALPWYAFNEPGRQEAFADELAHFDIEEGEHWYSTDGFGCADCHGPTGGGGGAEWTEERSGVSVTWAVPSLDDVLYRYSEDEVSYWIEYGRSGTPMPANGLEGGGAMTVQEIDQTIEFLKSIQVSQADAYNRAESAAAQALSRIEGGETGLQTLINRQQAEIDDVEAASDKVAVVGTYPDDIMDLFQAPGTCTSETAALVGATCDDAGSDTDRDGVSDETEKALSTIAASAKETITVLTATPNDAGVSEYTFEPNSTYDVRFDAFTAFTNSTAEGPVADLTAAEELLSHLETDVLLLNVTAERTDSFLETLQPGLEFLEESLVNKPWEVDFAEVASLMEVSEDDAELAVGLFNAYCARCHTGGYSAGPSFEQGAGSGAWGPSLLDGRSLIQFPHIEDQIAFVVDGTDNAVAYGVNGIGSGRMPSFGAVLSEAQIELIVKYERSM